jgi:hypothetical protein
MISNRWLSVVAPVAVLLFCGCSSADAPMADGQDPDEQDIKSGKNALEGEACGAKQCTKGLVCAKKDDGSGVCKKAPSGACVGKSLPACPRACKGDETAGATCSKDGDVCGDSIGDKCTCSGGTFQCVVHQPLGPHCNMVCLP